MMPRKYLIAMFVLMLLPTLAGLGMRPFMPPSVPVHWGISGQPDRYGSPWELILTFALTNLFIGGLMLVLPVIGPMKANFQRFGETYGRICVTLLAGMSVIAIALLMKGMGRNIPVISCITVTLGVMLAVVGNWLGKVRRNFWVGIRTPWTLANERVWERTHRVGAKLMVLFGLALAGAGAFAPPIGVFIVTIAGAIGLAVWSLVYSYVIYHRLGGVDDMAPSAPSHP
jgi:uncharacterized membrane protein